MEFIELKDVYKIYKNGVTGLAGVNLKIKKGDFCFIIGQTASGKSTLIKLLYREEKPSKGNVTVGGVNVAKLRNSKIYKLRRKIGIVFQDYKLLPKLTVYENVAYPLESYGLSSKEIRPMVLTALEQVGLSNKTRSFPYELSGGEQQRVSIARAIYKDPSIILADEPTGALDSKTGVEVLKLLKKQCDANNGENTVVIVTHNSLIAEIADRVIRLKNGKVESNEINKKPKSIDEVVW